MRIGSGAADFRPIGVIRLANTGQGSCGIEKAKKRQQKSAPIGALLLFVLKLEIERFDLERLESEL